MPKVRSFSSTVRAQLDTHVSDCEGVWMQTEGYFKFPVPPNYSPDYLSSLRDRLNDRGWLVKNSYDKFRALIGFHPPTRAEYILNEMIENCGGWEFEFEKDIEDEWTDMVINALKTVTGLKIIGKRHGWRVEITKKFLDELKTDGLELEIEEE